MGKVNYIISWGKQLESEGIGKRRDWKRKRRDWKAKGLESEGIGKQLESEAIRKQLGRQGQESVLDHIVGKVN